MPSAVAAWLLDTSERRAPEQLLAALSERLVEAGVPLWRSATSVFTLHPEVYLMNLRWRRDSGSERILRPHGLRSSPEYIGSPVAEIHAGGPARRLRLDPPPDYPVLRELAAAGGTDYFIQPLRFSDGRLSFVSFTSDHPGGFTDGHLELFDEVRPLLALRLEIEGAYYATRSLLEVYLGQNAAARVLAGEVRRGAGELASAAIFFCDMRGFTHFTDEHPVGEVVETLDRYFETVAAPIEAEGGEVLKFIGDALLAVFAGGGDSAEACRRALRAAALALDGMDAWNATRGSAGQPPLSIGIALHHGEVLYGNIGANRRLDFTVIGRAVNEASRVESLCKTLRVPLLATRTFASLLGPGPLRAVGAHALRGVVAPQELFTLASRG